MRAVRFHEYGDAGVLRVEEVPEPEPGEGQVSLRVRAAGVNPVDWKILHGMLDSGPLQEPRGLGVDVAGVVERVGPGVDDLVPGSEVFGSSASPAYAEVALADRRLLLVRPPSLPWEVLGSLAVVAGTAYATLDRLGLREGETLLLFGASGGVGLVAAQLAVARGVKVIGTASEAKLGLVGTLGATPVAYGAGMLERLREQAPDGVSAVLDASGHGELSAGVELAGGADRVLTIASYGDAQELGVPFHAGGGGELTVPAMQEIVTLLEAGSFVFPVAGVYGLGQVADALRESEHGHPQGKLVVVPS